jgi:hypothetical protein
MAYPDNGKAAAVAAYQTARDAAVQRKVVDLCSDSASGVAAAQPRSLDRGAARAGARRRTAFDDRGNGWVCFAQNDPHWWDSGRRESPPAAYAARRRRALWTLPAEPRRSQSQSAMREPAKDNPSSIRAPAKLITNRIGLSARRCREPSQSFAASNARRRLSMSGDPVFKPIEVCAQRLKLGSGYVDKRIGYAVACSSADRLRQPRRH